jgi:hypothetical protein
MNKPELNGYIRNSAGNTFQITEFTEERVGMKPYDFNGKSVVMGRRVFDQMCKNKNFDTVNNPSNIHERMDTKQFASRFLN